MTCHASRFLLPLEITPGWKVSSRRREAITSHTNRRLRDKWLVIYHFLAASWKREIMRPGDKTYRFLILSPATRNSSFSFFFGVAGRERIGSDTNFRIIAAVILRQRVTIMLLPLHTDTGCLLFRTVWSVALVSLVSSWAPGRRGKGRAHETETRWEGGGKRLSCQDYDCNLQ